MGTSAAEVERLLRAARLCLAKSEVHEAVERASEAIRLNAKEPVAYVLRAEAHRKLKRGDRALADLAVAIRLDPNQPGPYVVRAEILKQRNMFDQAIADASHAIIIDPRSAAAYSIRAECRSAIGDQDGAIEDVQEMVRIDPTRPVPDLRDRSVSGDATASMELDDEQFRKQSGRKPSNDLTVFADRKPVDKTYRSRRVVSDEEAPEALGVASGYKPGTISRPIPRMRGQARKSVGDSGGGILGIGVMIIAGCSLWMVFRATPDPSKTPTQVYAPKSPLVRSDVKTEESNKQRLLNRSDAIGSEPTTKDLGSFTLTKGGRSWNVTLPQHFTKAEVIFYRGDLSDLTLNAAWEGHLQINGKDVIRFKQKSYRDVFFFHDFTTDEDYMEKNDYKKIAPSRYLDVTNYLRPGDNTFYYYHEQRPDLAMGIVLRTSENSQIAETE